MCQKNLDRSVPRCAYCSEELVPDGLCRIRGNLAVFVFVIECALITSVLFIGGVLLFGRPSDPIEIGILFMVDAMSALFIACMLQPKPIWRCPRCGAIVGRLGNWTGD